MKRFKVYFVLFAVFWSGHLASKTLSPEANLALDSDQIREALVGKRISYSPSGWVDMGIDEEFHTDGTWRGVQMGIGPAPFSGRWTIDRNMLCVIADPGTVAERWHKGLYCRRVWEERKSRSLRIGYLPEQPSSSRKWGMMTPTVRNLDRIP